MATYCTFLLFALCLVCIVQSCPDSVGAKCKCQLVNGQLNVDCSQLTLVDLVKLLEDANLPINLLEVHDNNNLRDLPAKVFNKIKINKIDMSNNYIARVDPTAFVGQEESLTDVNLSNNSLSILPNLSSLRNLQNLDLSGNTIGDIRDAAFAQNPNLKTLRLERNKICNLGPNALNETKGELELLDLSGNCFYNVPAANLRNYQKLAYLDLSGNRIADVPNLQFMNMPGLKELRLNDNNINSLYPLAFMNVPSLEQLDLARNRLASLDTSRFQSFDKLSVLDLSGNKLSKVATSAFKDMKNLKQLILDDNNITSVETLAFSSMNQLQMISLQNNNLRQLYRNAFDALPSMQILLLGNNRLATLEAGMLSGMPSLQQLHVRNNTLTSIQANAFEPLPQLTTLDLGRNQLVDIPVDCFRKMNKLFWLDLSDNKIKSLESGAFMSKVSNMLLQGNPWDCDPKIDWFVRYLVANGVRTFLPGQPEVVCVGPPEYSNTLLKDLMIKKANETFFKTFGGAQGLLGNGLAQIPGLEFLSGGFGGADGVTGVGGKSGGGGGGILEAISGPVNTLVGAGVATDIIRTLPGLVASFPSVKAAPGAAGDPFANVDFSKIPPGIIQHVMRGGQIPGVPPETLQRLIQQYMQQMTQPTGVPMLPPPVPPMVPPVAGAGQNGSNEVITDSVPLPPLSSLPPELIQSVMNGGLIPGLTKEQTEAVKQKYMKMLSGPSSSGNGSIGLGALPPEVLASVNVSQLSPEVITDMAAGRVPDLSKIPPDVIQALINKRPDLFAQMVDKVLQTKIDQGMRASGIWDKLPPTQQVPVQVAGHPYDVNDLDNKADLSYYKKDGSANYALWTGLGLGVVGILTTATILFLCYKRRKARRRSEDNDGTKFFSTPKSSQNSLPVHRDRSNNNLPTFYGASTITGSGSRSIHNQSDLEYVNEKPLPPKNSWVYSTQSASFKKTEM